MPANHYVESPLPGPAPSTAGLSWRRALPTESEFDITGFNIALYVTTAESDVAGPSTDVADGRAILDVRSLNQIKIQPFASNGDDVVNEILVFGWRRFRPEDGSAWVWVCTYLCSLECTSTDPTNYPVDAVVAGTAFTPFAWADQITVLDASSSPPGVQILGGTTPNVARHAQLDITGAELVELRINNYANAIWTGF